MNPLTQDEAYPLLLELVEELHDDIAEEVADDHACRFVSGRDLIFVRKAGRLLYRIRVDGYELPETVAKQNAAIAQRAKLSGRLDSPPIHGVPP